MPHAIDGATNGPKIVWPGGRRIAVMVTFDFDAEFLRLSRAQRKRASAGFTDLSRGRYGPYEGLARCLRVLDLHDVKSTFFLPGIVAEQYPDEVRAIHEHGHEIAAHGYEHESASGISADAERVIFEKAERALAEITGRRPVGYRAPESILQPSTIDLLAERKYLYESTMKDCDWAYLLDVEGSEGPVVELPNDVTMDDFTYYYFTFSNPAVRSMYTNREVFDNWKAEFDGLAEEGNKIFVLKLHPDLIGRASRAIALGEFIAYMKRHGAWIDTCENVATYVLAQNRQSAGPQASDVKEGGIQ